MANLAEKWQKSVISKGSIICAGLDPAKYELGREEQGLPKGANLVSWGKKYIKAVANYVAGIKINPAYFESSDELQELIEFAKSLELVVVYDAKIADITDTNEAEIFFAAKRGVDAITVAPFAGNLAASTKLAHRYNIGILAVCLMSATDYVTEKNMIATINDREVAELDSLKFSAPHFRQRLSLQMLPEKWFETQQIPRYAYLALQIRMCGADGAIIGISSSLLKEEILITSTILPSDTLILVPGIGFQGGDYATLGGIFDPKRLMISSSRALMYPLGIKSSPHDQQKAAKNLKQKIWQYFSKQIKF